MTGTAESAEGGSVVGRLVVGDQRYVKGAIRTLWVSVSDIRYTTGYSDEFARKHLSANRRLTGTALIRDSIAIMGSERPSVRQLDLHITPHAAAVTAETARLTGKEIPEAATVIGFSGRDWEIGNDASWFLQIYLAQDAFDEVVSQLGSGTLHGLFMGLDCGLWVRSHDVYTPHSGRVTWYLRPREKDGDVEWPEMECGRLTNLTLAQKGLKLPGRVFDGVGLEETALDESDGKNRSDADAHSSKTVALDPEAKAMLLDLVRTMKYAAVALVCAVGFALLKH